MTLLFGIGYIGIIFEESLAFNKSGVGLLMGVSLWAVRCIGVRLFLFLMEILVVYVWQQCQDLH